MEGYVRFQEYSRNAASTIRMALMQHMAHKFWSYYMINMTKMYVLCCSGKASRLSERLRAIKSIKEHFM